MWQLSWPLFDDFWHFWPLKNTKKTCHYTHKHTLFIVLNMNPPPAVLHFSSSHGNHPCTITPLHLSAAQAAALCPPKEALSLAVVFFLGGYCHHRVFPCTFAHAPQRSFSQLGTLLEKPPRGPGRPDTLRRFHAAPPGGGQAVVPRGRGRGWGRGDDGDRPQAPLADPVGGLGPAAGGGGEWANRGGMLQVSRCGVRAHVA